jgi:Protein of unknown function (DUF2846)
LAACATAPLESQTKQQDQRQARIYFLRESSLVFAAGAPNVKVDGQQVGTVANGSYFFVDRAPGPRTITLETPLVPGRFAANVTVRPGGVYYLKVSPRNEYLAAALLAGAVGQFVDAAVSENSGSYSLTPLEEKAGAALLAQLKR